MIKVYFMKNIIKASKELLGAFTIIFIIFATYSCSTLPGMNEEPEAQKGSKKIIVKAPRSSFEVFIMFFLK